MKPMWSWAFQTYRGWADLDALMVNSVFEIKDDERRLELLIEHLRILDKDTYARLNFRLDEFKKAQHGSIMGHKKNELNVWGSDFDSRMAYFMTRERLGAKDPRWVEELHAYERVLEFLEWLIPSVEAAWKVVDARRDEGWRSRKPSDGEPDNVDVQIFYNDGKSLYLKKKFTEAFGHFREAAKYGHPAALNALGMMSYNGYGCLQDDVQAAKWFRRAADEHEERAWFNLYWIYSIGRGVTKDSALALRYLRAAANAGLGAAQYSQGFQYQMGQGKAFDIDNPRPEQNFSEAAKWYRLAADRDDAGAMRQLARFYEEGLGVAVNADEAARWKKKAERYENVIVDYFLVRSTL